MDVVSAEKRRQVMAAVPQRDSAPEMVVRRMGYRYRLQVRQLAGSPDLVFSRLKTVVFDHGCFWHRHWCKRAATPATRRGFWAAKFEQNEARDLRNNRVLRRTGWGVLIVWERWTRRPEWLKERLARFLAS